MASENFAFNISKARIGEYYDNVEANSPSGCEIVLIPLTTGGSEAQGRDFDDVAAVLGDANFTEAGVAWGRKDQVAADLATPAKSGNTFPLAVPAETWATVASSNDTTGLLIAYDPTGASADSALIPLTHHIFNVTTDGNDVVLNAGNFVIHS